MVAIALSLLWLASVIGVLLAVGIEYNDAVIAAMLPGCAGGVQIGWLVESRYGRTGKL